MPDKFSRRDFLKTFAALSAAPLFAGVLSGCGSTDPMPRATYGPAPPGTAAVSGMFFLDGQSSPVSLYGNQAVPINTSFVIEFNVLMDVASVAAAVLLIGPNNTAVACSVAAGQNAQNSTSVFVTSSVDLTPGTSYTLSVDGSAKDSNGNTLTVNSGSSADFRTMA